MRRKGSVTVFLSLIFLLLLSFIGVMIEAASLEVGKNYRRAEMDLALHSIFGEYQIELLEEYDVFSLEGTYESGNFSYDNIFERARYYGSGEAIQQMEGIQLLSDEQGRAFLEQVSAYTKSRMGVTDMKEWSEKEDLWEAEEKRVKEYEEESIQVQQEMEKELAENEEELPKENNPISEVAMLKGTGILTFLIPEKENISSFQVELEKLPSKRSLRKGEVSFPYKERDVQLSVEVNQYIMEHFECYVDENKEGWQYELEYLIAAKNSDLENLKTIVWKLAAVRFVPNYAHLLSNNEKQLEAETLALSLCAVLAVPAVSKIVKQAILLAWAYGESLLDVKSLLEGKKVSMVKTAEEWQLSMENLLKLGTKEFETKERDMEEGMGYKDYLRMLLFLEKPETLSMRALDLIEYELRAEKGLDFFRVDNCISKMRIQSTYKMRRGIQYSFYTEFYYQ